jgi:type I restriction enzyme S subunit
MIKELKPYPEYKDASQAWLGSIPAGWVEKRAKYFLREVDERSTTGTEQLMSISHITGVTPRKQSVTMFLAESNVGHKICHAGDVVINTMWAWMGALGVARKTGLVSPSYGVYRPLNPSIHVPAYLDYLLRTQEYVGEYRRRSTGIRASRLRLYPGKFLDMDILCPPRVEQVGIVAFLGAQNRIIKRYIDAKRREIELLNEKKQAIIHRAVTRGLDPTVHFKPSGIPWLGEIPQHWEVRKIRAVSTRITKGTTPTTLGKEFVETGIRFLKVESISKDLTILRNKCAYIDAATDELLSRSRLRAGDVVVAIAGAIGRPAIILESLLPANANQAVAIISPATKQCLSEWLVYVLSSPMCLRAMTDSSVQSAQANLSLASLGHTVIPLPPVSEQVEILASLPVEIGALATAVARLEREIELLREYRAHLVADVATGKLDVGGIEPLPLPESEVVDDLADVEETETDEDAELIAETTNADD